MLLDIYISIDIYILEFLSKNLLGFDVNKLLKF